MRKAILLLITTPAWAGELTVSSTGDGPKALLAYHIKDGAKQRAHVRFNVDINVEAGGVTQEQHAPIVDAYIDAKTIDNHDGTYNITFVYSKVKVSGGEGQMASQAVADGLMALKGTSGSLVVSSSGEVLTKDAHLTGADGAASKLPFDMRDLGARLPSEPVGVGAVWTQHNDVPTELGVTFEQHTTYTLQALGAGTATIGIDITQTAPPGPIDPSASGVSGLPAGAINLERMNAHGNGTLTIDLGKPFVTTGALEIALDMVMRMEIMGTSQTIGQDVKTHMLMMPK
jgi:hypothetical protein